MINKLHTAYITHPDCLNHEMGAYHPESPQRLVTIEHHLQVSGLLSQLQRYDAPCASIKQLALVHSRDYIEHIHRDAPESGLTYLDLDTA